MRKQHFVLPGIFLLTILVLSGCNNSSNPVSTNNTAGTVAIGSQVWADKNLDVSTYRNGDPIPQVQDSIAWSNLTTGAWCYYNGDAGLGATYGKIYNWYAVNDSRGLAPLGYHIPSDTEWMHLTNYLGGDTIAGGKLKALTLWQAPNTGATNSSGFTALPGGYDIGLAFFDITTRAWFWSASDYTSSTTAAWYRKLFNNFEFVDGGIESKSWGLTTRCVNDCGAMPPSLGINIPSTNQIIWNWNTVTGATGYKWNTTNDYSTAIDLGTTTTYTETGLSCGNSYARYVWAYNTCGTWGSSILSQSTVVCCPASITDGRDGKVYNTVMIGLQCWMAQNLNVGARINGSVTQTNNSIIEKYCYNNLESNCDVYGGLYQWDEWMNYSSSSETNPSGRQGICPAGWHVPSDAELCQMETYLDATVNCANTGLIGTDAGGKMKETGTVHWASPNTGATNSSGFTALPGGDRATDGSFWSLTTFVYFWTSTEYTPGNAWYRDLDNLSAQEDRWRYSKTEGHSGRCVKN